MAKPAMMEGAGAPRVLVPALGMGLALSLALHAAPAGASGFQLKEQSAEGLGNAFAGATAKAYDPSTAFWNPAGMTRLQGHHASVIGSYISPSSRFKGSATSATGAPVSGSHGGDAAKDAFVPATYGIISLTDDLKLGLAVNAPFGLSTEYPSDWVGRYQALESHLHTVAVTPTVAYRITDDISIGAGPVIQYASVTLTTGINNMGLLPYDGQGKVSGDDVGFGFTVGALWEIDEGTRIGASYRSRVKHTFEGDASYSNVHPVLAARGGLVNSDATAKLTTPDTASLGVYHDINDQWAVVGEVAWTNWSLFEELRVDADVGADSLTIEDWHDTVFVSIGGIYRPNENWSFRIGAAYDMSPIPDEHRTARIPGEDRYWLATGASYHVADWLSLDVGFTHIFVNDSSLNETTSQGTLIGSYENDIDIVTVGGRIRF